MKAMIPALAGIVLASLAAGVFLLLRANLDVGAVVWAFFGLFLGVIVPWWGFCLLHSDERKTAESTQWTYIPN